MPDYNEFNADMRNAYIKERIRVLESEHSQNSINLDIAQDEPGEDAAVATFTRNLEAIERALQKLRTRAPERDANPQPQPQPQPQPSGPPA